MADNTQVNNGTGDTVRDVQKGGTSGPKTQVVILDRGGSGTEDLGALGDANYGLDVDLHFSAQARISQTPTVSSSPAYSSGDCMGGLLTFANAARVSGGSGMLLNVTVMCKTPALAWAGLELLLFNQTFTAGSDNAANGFSDADMANAIAVVKLSDWIDYTNNSICSRQVQIPYALTGTSLFGQLVTRSAISLGSTSDIIVSLDVQPN